MYRTIYDPTTEHKIVRLSILSGFNICHLLCRMGGKLEDIEFKKQMYKPGPGNNEAEKRHDIPSMKFGSGQRSSLEVKTFSPGPGAYTQENRTQKSAPRFGFGTSTRKPGTKLNVPGPGNYASKTFTGREMPSFSMGAISTYSPERKE